jgi:hypothetical protein
MNRLVNAFVIYKFVKLLATSFKNTEAYKLGIIDEKGNYLKKQKDLKTHEEKMASNIFTRLVWNIKKLLEKLPFGKSKLASVATALFLVKEEVEKAGVDRELIETVFNQYMIQEYEIDYKQEILKEVMHDNTMG